MYRIHIPKRFEGKFFFSLCGKKFSARYEFASVHEPDKATCGTCIFLRKAFLKELLAEHDVKNTHTRVWNERYGWTEKKKLRDR